MNIYIYIYLFIYLLMSLHTDTCTHTHTHMSMRNRCSTCLTQHFVRRLAATACASLEHVPHEPRTRFTPASGRSRLMPSFVKGTVCIAQATGMYFRNDCKLGWRFSARSCNCDTNSIDCRLLRASAWVRKPCPCKAESSHSRPWLPRRARKAAPLCLNVSALFMHSLCRAGVTRARAHACKDMERVGCRVRETSCESGL